MRTRLLGLVLLVPAAAAAGPPAYQPPQSPGDVAAAEGQAIRALAIVSAGEPGVEALQRAAAVEVDRSDGGAVDYPGRARLAALLPTISAEYRHDQASNRTTGLQSSGEVDYLRLTPSDAFLVRATWDLGSLVASPGELTAGTQAQVRARRRAEAVERVTRLFFERQRLRVALLLAPPTDPVARAQAELDIARLGADIEALIGWRSGERAP